MTEFKDNIEDPLVKSSVEAINSLITPDDKQAEPRFISRGILLLYGSAYSGKTSLCLDVAINSVLKKLKVLYIDTERSIDIWRLRQIIKARNLKLAIETKDNMYIIDSLRILYEPTLNGLLKLLPEIQRNKPDVLIVDNPVSHYLMLILKESYGKTSKDLIHFSGQIKIFTGIWNMACIFTSQPVSDIKKQEILELEKGVGIGAHDARDFIGGKSFDFDPKVIVKVNKKGTVEREMILVKHRNKRIGQSCKFKITDKGVEDI